MNFYEMLSEKVNIFPQKYAFITDAVAYTYQSLWQAIERAREQIERQVILLPKKERRVWFIDEDCFEQQLIQWFAAIGANCIPVVSHYELAEEKKDALRKVCETCPYENADIGVLSSGSTGLPKVLWRADRTWIEFFPVQNQIFHISGETRLFLHGSYSFTGNMNALLSVFFAGGSVVTTDTFSPKIWLMLCNTYDINTVYLLPTKLRLLLTRLRQDGTNKQQIPALQTIFTGSQLLDKKLMDGLHLYFPEVDFILYYGASELNYITWCTATEWYAEPNTVGKPFLGITLSIQDSQVFVETPYAVEGIQMPYSVGDEGWISETGRLMFKGRSSAIINYGGYKISVAGMEENLKTLSSVRDAVVLAEPDPLRGEIPVAYIVPEEEYFMSPLSTSNTEFIKEHILAEIREHLPTLDSPRRIIIVGKIPLNSSSKPDKAKLEQLGL